MKELCGSCSGFAELVVPAKSFCLDSKQEPEGHAWTVDR